MYVLVRTAEEIQNENPPSQKGGDKIIETWRREGERPWYFVERAKLEALR